MTTSVLHIIIALLLVASTTTWSAEPLTAPTEGFWKYRVGIVHIGLAKTSVPTINPPIERWLGTGFAVDNTCTFATAKHVFGSVDRERIVVRFQVPDNLKKTRTFFARVLYESPTTDLAFVKLVTLDNTPCQTNRLYTFGLRRAADLLPLTGKEIYIIGYPVLARENVDIPIIRRGIIASTEIHYKSGPMLLLDLIGVPGFSGSPVILPDSGEAIGVVLGPGPTPRAAGFEWATPITKEDYDQWVSGKSSDQSLGK